MSDHIFSAEKIEKRYGATHALRGVDFRLKAGEIRGLIGANGAGKSTLCKIIAGVEDASAGKIWMGDREVNFKSVHDAMDAGIGMVHQELSLLPNMSVAENIFLGREQTTAWSTVDFSSQEQASAQVLQRLGVEIAPSVLVSDLTVGAEQMVEIAKVLARDVDVMLLDEPTSALGDAEIKALFDVVRNLARQGVAIVYISHKLDELLEICDTLTVLRDGEAVAEAECADVNPSWIVARMTGEDGSISIRNETRPSDEIILSATGLCTQRRFGKTTLSDVSFDLRSGERLGLFGLMGAGRTETLEAVFGALALESGAVTLDGDLLSDRPIAERISAGMVFLSEDRKRFGLVHGGGVRSNMSLSSLSGVSRHGVIDQSREKEKVRDQIAALRIKTASSETDISALSGGNQQKVLLARNLMCDPRIVLLDEPTRGVDVAAKSEILSLICDWSQDGGAALIASSEPEELLSVCTRILVLSNGRVSAEFDAISTTVRDLYEAASVTNYGVAS